MCLACLKRFGSSEQEPTRIFLCFEGAWRDSESCCISGVDFFWCVVTLALLVEQGRDRSMSWLVFNRSMIWLFARI